MNKRGSISLFMAVIILSMFVMSSVFTDGARIRNSKVILQSAADSAANSVLAKYDKQLKQRYGLFALDEESAEAIQEDFYGFLLENISSQLPNKNGFKQLAVEILRDIEQGFDLYNFNIEADGFNVDKIYSIIEPQILKNQINEFSKYRSALVMKDFLDFAGEIEEFAKKNKKDVENIQNTIEFRQRMQDISKDFSEIKEEMVSVTESFNELNDTYEPMMAYIAEYLEIYNTLCEELSDMKDTLSELEEDNEKGQNDKEIEELSESISELEKEINDLEKLLKAEEPQLYSWFQTVSSFESDFIEQRNNCLLKLQKAEALYTDIKEYIPTVEGGSENVRKQIEDDLNGYLSKLENIINSGLESWYKEAVSYLNGLKNELKSMSEDILSASVASESICIPNSGDYPQFEYDVQQQDKNKVEIIKKFYDNSKKNKNKQDKSGLNIEISKQQLKNLPSQTYEKYKTEDNYLAEDNEYINELIKSGEIYSISSAGDYKELDFIDYDFPEFNETAQSKEDITGNFEAMDSILDGLLQMTNNTVSSVMSDIYIMGMFRTRITNSADEWKKIYNNKNFNETDLFYTKRDKENEINLNFENKSDYSHQKGNSFFNSEIEYILEGKNKQQDNERNIYLKIYSMRLVNNWIAVYTNNELRELSEAAALLIAAFTFGTAAPIFELAIITALAAAETALDMYFLINMGYRIPFIKTSQNISINIDNLMKTSESLILGEGLEPVCDSAFNVSYENYLYFFLLLTSQDIKLLRMADIIQLNMSIDNPEYILAEHSVYLRYDIKSTIKPLFMSYSFVPDNIRRNGRISVRSLGYRGY